MAARLGQGNDEKSNRKHHKHNQAQDDADLRGVLHGSPAPATNLRFLAFSQMPLPASTRAHATDTFILGVLLRSDGASMRARHLAFVLLATMVMATIPLLAGPQVLGQVNLTLTMRDALTFSPGSFSAAPGESVSLTLINAGALDHTFTLFAQADATVPVDDNAALQAYDAANTKIVDMSFAGGAQNSASFTAPTTEGTYTFVCLVAGHAVGGMHGTMTVTSPAPDGPALIDPLLIGVVVAVVVIVIAVSAVFILRRRS